MGQTDHYLIVSGMDLEETAGKERSETKQNENRMEGRNDWALYKKVRKLLTEWMENGHREKGCKSCLETIRQICYWAPEK